jgi:hypothetical protein
MNKKIFALALYALAALGSMSASAAITVTSSAYNTTDGYVQDANAKALAGGASVRANDIIIDSSGTDIPTASTSNGTDGLIVLRLPKGLNFDGDPLLVVTPATSGAGLNLKDGAGDPTINSATSSPTITYTDANGDGGNDRAVLTVGRAAAAGDSLTVSINLTVDAGVTAGTKTVSVIINGGIYTAPVVSVISKFAEPIFVAATPKTLDQSSGPSTTTLTAYPYVVTIPAGTKKGTTLTITPNTKLAFAPSPGTGTTGTITATFHSPLKASIFSSNTVNASASTTTSVNFSINSNVLDDTQVTFTTQDVWVKSSATVVGLNGFKLSGVVTGNVDLVDVKKNGSSAAIATGGKLTSIVAGGTSAQTLPSITITENFAGDLITKGSTATVTFTPSTGLTLTADTPTVSAGFGDSSSPTITISATGVATLTMSADPAGSVTKTVTITGLKAKTKATAVGTQTVTVGGSKTSAPASDVINVALAVPVGTVDVRLNKLAKVITTGQGAGGSTTVELLETTYGALTIKEKTASTNAYFTITPSSNAKVSAIALSDSGYASGTSPTISACAKETATSLTWVCQVTAESTAVVVGTSTISAAVTWAATATAEIGSSVTLAIGGNAGVSGELKVGTVGLTTKAEVTGAIPDVKPGSLTAVSLATVTISGLFDKAVTDTVGATFRVLAPAGVAFQDAAATQASTSISTATISSTFRPNDTLSLSIAKTATITFTPKAIVSSDAASGLISFDIVDGDINGKNLTLISPASLNLAYVDGTLKKLEAGKEAAVNVGFSVSNTVEGGLAPYTVATSAAATASPTVSGSVVSVEGKAAGAATITVTDALGATDTYVVTVKAGAAEPAQGKATKASDGSTSAATFTGGATIDGGTTYTDAITTADEVIINATINVDPEDVGEAGGIHAVVLSPAGLLMLESDGSWVPWDGVIAHVATYLEVDALAATYSVPLYNGAIATAGKWRFAVVYSTDTGKLVYTTKAAMITVSESE